MRDSCYGLWWEPQQSVNSEDAVARITVEIDDEVLAEAKEVLRTGEDEETMLKAVTIAVGAVYQRRAARQRLAEMTAAGDAFIEKRTA